MIAFLKLTEVRLDEGAPQDQTRIKVWIDAAVVHLIQEVVSDGLAGAAAHTSIAGVKDSVPFTIYVTQTPEQVIEALSVIEIARRSFHE